MFRPRLRILLLEGIRTEIGVARDRRHSPDSVPQFQMQ
jgi:hypothetical protein